ncbi:MAG: 2-oxoacid:acceptor oxidoreductase subunit alpha [Candidatus Gracilibacteria bacterium]|jgi:2-oxoglutarate ferredoxin oxidoreductase subunit alpha
MKTDVNILLGGAAGSGIEKTGRLISLSFVRGGYYVFANIEHMSQIRGGNNFLRIRVADEFKQCHVEKCDIVIALDAKTVEEHADEITEGGVVVYDGEVVKFSDTTAAVLKAKKVLLADAPLKKLAVEKFGNPVMANTISLGIVFGLVDFDLGIPKAALKGIFGGKSAEIITSNEKALDLGFGMAKEKWSKDFMHKLAGGGAKSTGAKAAGAAGAAGKMFLMGNDAACIGAVKAGVKYVGEYPMTPSSSVLHFMAKWAKEYGVVVKHTEDEIAAVNSVIGAGFAGARSLSGTSGGGFALMTEGIGLASMNEVPIVIFEVMRPGPATGLPTRTEAADLRQIIHAGQADANKIVLLPGDINECFEFGFMAFNLAEKYQLPVIVSYDKYLGEGYYTVAPFETKGMKINRGKLLTQKELDKISDYKRYLRTEDGVSPRVIPGMKGGIHRATSDEHNEYGEICETAENRKLMTEKRMKKMEVAMPELPKPEIIGDKKADITFVTWNSAKGACLEACEELKGRGIKANVLQIKTAWPFLKKETVELIKQCKRPIVVEQNYTAQMGGLIAECTGILIEEKILKYDGRPFTAKFILDNLKS